jgi:hypothetical protein
MKVYILIRNEYAMYEFDDDIVVAIYLDRNKANLQCKALNDTYVNECKYTNIVHRVDSYEVTL